MNLRELNQHFANVAERGESQDYTTGEYFDDLDALDMDIKQKIENTIAHIKNAQAFADALKAESKALAERAKRKEAQVERSKAWLAMNTEAGKVQEFITGVLGWRKSQAVEVAEGASLDPMFINVKETRTIDKVGLKAHLKQGHKLEGVTLVEKNNINIK